MVTKRSLDPSEATGPDPSAGTRLLPLKEAAPRLGLTECALKNRLLRGTIGIELIRLGNSKRPSLRVRESDVEAVIAGHAPGSAA